MECTRANPSNNFMKPTIRIMNSGDLVILYERHDSMTHIYLEASKIYNNKFGAFNHDDFIGKPYGSKIQSRSAKGGWIYALEASPALWSCALRVCSIVIYNRLFLFSFAMLFLMYTNVYQFFFTLFYFTFLPYIP